SEQNRPVTKAVDIAVPGLHRLWIRLLRASYQGTYTVALEQHGQVLAHKTIDEKDPQYTDSQVNWVWDSIAADLEVGTANIVLTRPDGGASWVTRKIDLFVLTNDTAYTPEIEHFLPHGYVRFTNLSEGIAPFCLWAWVRRHEPPWYA